MSFAEILIVLLVSFFVIKPEDIPKITDKIKDIRAFILNTKQEIFTYFDDTASTESNTNSSKDFSSQIEQMNFYLEKISNMGKEYEGEYTLESVKEYYREVMNQKISTELDKT